MSLPQIERVDRQLGETHRLRLRKILAAYPDEEPGPAFIEHALFRGPPELELPERMRSLKTERKKSAHFPSDLQESFKSIEHADVPLRGEMHEQSVARRPLLVVRGTTGERRVTSHETRVTSDEPRAVRSEVREASEETKGEIGQLAKLLSRSSGQSENLVRPIVEQIREAMGTGASFYFLMIEGLAEGGFFRDEGLTKLEAMAPIFNRIIKATRPASSNAFWVIKALAKDGFLNEDGLKKLEGLVPVFGRIREATGPAASHAFIATMRLAQRGFFRDAGIEKLEALVPIFRRISQAAGPNAPQTFHEITGLADRHFFKEEGLDRLKALADIAEATGTAAPDALGAISSIIDEGFF